MNNRSLQFPSTRTSVAIVDRESLPLDWPTHRGSRELWEELGRTVASFGFLEDTLARTCFALTGGQECKPENVDEEFVRKWVRSLEASLYDTLNELTKRICKVLGDDERIPREAGTNIVERLRALSVWRNALCHGAWTDFDADGSARLRFFRKTREGPMMLDDSLSREQVASIRAEIVDVTVSLMDVPGSIGVPFPGSPQDACPGEAPPPVQSAS